MSYIEENDYQMVKESLNKFHSNMTDETFEWISHIFENLQDKSRQDLLNIIPKHFITMLPVRKTTERLSTVRNIIAYLLDYVIELSGNATRDNKSGVITPRFMFLAIVNDDELKEIFKDNFPQLPILQDLSARAIKLGGKPIVSRLNDKIKEKNVKIDRDVKVLILNILARAANIYVTDKFKNTLYFSEIIKYPIQDEAGIKYFQAVLSDILLDYLRRYQISNTIKVLSFSDLDNVIITNIEQFDFLLSNF